jgi:hypothetical protein
MKDRNAIKQVIIENGRLAETMLSMSRFFARCRAENHFVGSGWIVAMFQSDYSDLLGFTKEQTRACPACKGEQEIIGSQTYIHEQGWCVIYDLACGHDSHLRIGDDR